MTRIPLLEFTDCYFDGGFDLRGAEVLALRLWACVVEAANTPALIADRLTVRHGLMLSRGFLAISSSSEPTVSMSGATIGGQLSICDAHICNHGDGVALRAVGVDVGQSVMIEDGTTAMSTSSAATLHIPGAQVGGQLTVTNATILNLGTGSALDATSVHVQHDVVIKTLVATSAGPTATVSLESASVGGDMDADRMYARNAKGPAFVADGVRIDHNLILTNVGTSNNSTAVDLSITDARVGGSIAFGNATDRITGKPHRIALDGLRFETLTEGSISQWVRILAHQTPSYAPQPYQHLALAAQRAGNDQDLRTVRIAQRRDQLRRATSSRWERSWGWVTYVTLGYGYRPWLALLWLLGVVFASALFTTALSAGLSVPSTDPQQDCARVDQVLVAIDQSLPLVKSGVGDRCGPNSEPEGQTLAAAGPAIQLLGWGFATLFVAGFTGAVRKT